MQHEESANFQNSSEQIQSLLAAPVIAARHLTVTPGPTSRYPQHLYEHLEPCGALVQVIQVKQRWGTIRANICLVFSNLTQATPLTRRRQAAVLRTPIAHTTWQDSTDDLSPSFPLSPFLSTVAVMMRSTHRTIIHHSVTPSTVHYIVCILSTRFNIDRDYI